MKREKLYLARNPGKPDELKVCRISGNALDRVKALCDETSMTVAKLVTDLVNWALERVELVEAETVANAEPDEADT